MNEIKTHLQFPRSDVGHETPALSTLKGERTSQQFRQVNGLNVYRTLTSPIRLHRVSHYSHSPIDTVMMVSYIVTTAALGWGNGNPPVTGRLLTATQD